MKCIIEYYKGEDGKYNLDLYNTKKFGLTFKNYAQMRKAIKQRYILREIEAKEIYKKARRKNGF